MRTDANNLVTTASTTHLPEQKETIHMIQMLRKESSSGAIEDLAHVISENCLSDALTKNSAKPEALLKAVETGILRAVDTVLRRVDCSQDNMKTVDCIKNHSNIMEHISI